MHRYVSAGLRGAADRLLPLIDRAEASDGKPFDEPRIFVPNTDSRRFGWTHYGVMIPDLPEPHRFFSVMSLIGATGSLAFDTTGRWPRSRGATLRWWPAPPRRTRATSATTRSAKTSRRTPTGRW